jgi:hypothetical protein
MQEKEVKKIAKFSIIGIILLFLVIKIVFFLIKSGEPDIIKFGKIEAMISKDTYTASNKISKIDSLKKFQEDFNNDVMTHCEETDQDFNPNEYMKLTINTDKGIFINSIYPEDNIFFESYSPEIVYSITRNSYNYAYLCPDIITKKYKKILKKY